MVAEVEVAYVLGQWQAKYCSFLWVSKESSNSPYYPESSGLGCLHSISSDQVVGLSLLYFHIPSQSASQPNGQIQQLGLNTLRL